MLLASAGREDSYECQDSQLKGSEKHDLARMLSHKILCNISPKVNKFKQGIESETQNRFRFDKSKKQLLLSDQMA